MDAISMAFSQKNKGFSASSKGEVLSVAPNQNVSFAAAYGMVFGTLSGFKGLMDFNTVLFNNDTYSLNKKKYGDNHLSNFENYIGNINIYNDSFDDTGEPFVIFGNGMIIIRGGMSSAKIEISGYDYTHNSLLYDNMPNGYPTKSQSFTCSLFDKAFYETEGEIYFNSFIGDSLYSFMCDGVESTHAPIYTTDDYNDPVRLYGNPALFTWINPSAIVTNTNENFCLAVYDNEFMGQDMANEGYSFFADGEAHELSAKLYKREIAYPIDAALLPDGCGGIIHEWHYANMASIPYVLSYSSDIPDLYLYKIDGLTPDISKLSENDDCYVTINRSTIHITWNVVKENGSSYAYSDNDYRIWVIEKQFGQVSPGVYIAHMRGEYPSTNVSRVFFKYEDIIKKIDSKYLPENSLLPAVTTADNGKTLKVVDGKWTVV